MLFIYVNVWVIAFQNQEQDSLKSKNKVSKKSIKSIAAHTVDLSPGLLAVYQMLRAALIDSITGS